jgi:GNAT superfamily N-acetyltransferase
VTEPVELLGQPWDRALTRVDGFMRTRPVAMTVEEFLVLPQLYGLKMEYFDGKLHIESRHLHVPVRTRLRNRPGIRPLRMRQPAHADSAELTELFYDSFRGTIDYCDYPPDAIRKSGGECVESFYTGKQGPPLESSRLAIDDAGAIIGVALIIRGFRGPSLDLLMVRPDWQRLGIAAATLNDAMSALLTENETELHSAYHLLNMPSARWHARMGFTLRPDYLYASTRLNHLHHRLVWQRGTGIEPKELAAMRRERSRLRRMAPSLVDEEMARRGQSDVAEKENLVRHLTHQ